MRKFILPFFCGALLSVIGVLTHGAFAASAPKVGPNSIGGTVTSPAGPEAGVWVMAETNELGNRLLKIVVTDEQGRFVLPELPKAKYKVWARGYGLVDSKPVEAQPGATVKLTTAAAADAKEAAQIYPSNYWSSLIEFPAASEFPGTGPKGNGIAPNLREQEHWIGHMAENCQFCHQLGNLATRTVADASDPVEAWSQRTHKDRSPDDVFFEGDKTYQGRFYGERMSNLMTLFGRERGLGMFADWTTRIAKGELPASKPARPAGVERNIVITTWDMGGGHFMHDSNSTDKRNPTVNANGPIYGYGTFSGTVQSLDPKTGERKEYKLTDRKGGYFKNANNHTGMMDAKGRIWMSNIAELLPMVTRTSQGENPDYCTDPGNPFAKYFPRPAKEARIVTMFDPKTGKNEIVTTCFGTHHLNFDKDERLYFSGDTNVVGWLNVKTLDETHDVGKSVGWCPFVLDTNGDGKITPDSTQWNEIVETHLAGGEGESHNAKEAIEQTKYIPQAAHELTKPLDPTKDTRIAGHNYGMAVSPTDQSYWGAKYTPFIPSGILRVTPGPNPPITCMTEYWEPPKVNGKYLAYNIRGVDVDTDGIAWVAFGSGAIGRFDRTKCKVKNGPTATGQHCPEGWEIIEAPGPKYKGLKQGTDWFYVTFVDHHNTLGLGKNVPVFPNSVGDELLAYVPKEKKFVHLRIPYPLGFYPRGLDGRIDDEKAGWKGRGIWATNNIVPMWHQETGEGSTEYAAHFQVRPNPLAE
jgi:hypothetical protein